MTPVNILPPETCVALVDVEDDTPVWIAVKGERWEAPVGADEPTIVRHHPPADLKALLDARRQTTSNRHVRRRAVFSETGTHRRANGTYPTTRSRNPMATDQTISGRLAIDQQRALVRHLLDEQGIRQSQLAKMIGRTEKHVSQVLTGKAGTAELDYWLFVLGYRFVVSVEEL